MIESNKKIMSQSIKSLLIIGSLNKLRQKISNHD